MSDEELKKYKEYQKNYPKKKKKSWKEKTRFTK